MVLGSEQVPGISSIAVEKLNDNYYHLMQIHNEGENNVAAVFVLVPLKLWGERRLGGADDVGYRGDIDL